MDPVCSKLYMQGRFAGLGAQVRARPGCQARAGYLLPGKRVTVWRIKQFRTLIPKCSHLVSRIISYCCTRYSDRYSSINNST